MGGAIGQRANPGAVPTAMGVGLIEQDVAQRADAQARQQGPVQDPAASPPR